MERDDWPPDWNPDLGVLEIKLAKLTIQSMGDVLALQEEHETLVEDFPGFKIIIFRP